MQLEIPIDTVEYAATIVCKYGKKVSQSGSRVQPEQLILNGRAHHTPQPH